ncbi:hypothetical protein ID866_11843 [Astraeus odoratus]|nr:hypothetical protein ID866_11843 [Astraeus odoratus]
MLKWKPHDPPKTTPPVKQCKIGVKDAPHTSAQLLITSSHKNLTLSDWMTIYSYVDSHPDIPQSNMVQYFSTLKTRALIFTQSTLSHRLHDHSKMEAHINSNPTPLSSKRPHIVIVTWPDVDCALYLWVQHMESKGEHVTGPMLQVKHSKFEEEFEVPKKERLPGEGWLQSFCKTYKIQEHW